MSIGLYWYDDKELAEERGHRRIRCPYCRYQGWSDDCGDCPRCPGRAPEEAESEQAKEKP